jgi:hypothetical protein
MLIAVAGTRKPVAQAGRSELTPSPAGIMIPGGVEQIQDALKQLGLLGSDYQRGELDETTAVAVRRFQEQNHLAQTGVPDHQTVHELGLDADRVFKPAP